MDIAEIQRKITPILRDHGVTRAALFGSHARGTARPDSDVDLMVRFERPTGMIGYMHFIEAAEQALGLPVDVVTERSAKTRLLPYIEEDLHIIYEE